MSATPEHPWVDAAEYDDELDHDFDEAWADLKPKRVRILGRVYNLPPERPAKVMILLIRERKQRKSDGERNMALLEEILTTMFGEVAYQRILADGIGLDSQVGDVVDYCMSAYNKPTPDGEEDEQGEAPPPKRGASSATGRSSSSATGGPSKPTSRPSTRST